MDDTQERTAQRRSRRAPAPGSRAADAQAAGPAPDGPIVPANRAPIGPANAKWRALLAEGDGAGPILADGAMGTMLFANGLQFGDPPEAWNIAHPDVVRRIHRGYVDAGSRILLTNTFGGNRLRLRLHGLESRVSDLNRTAAILLR